MTSVTTRAARPRVLALAVAVGVVLADSSIVILALPEILAEYESTVAQVAWVLTAYNLVLALTAVPAAYLARRGHPALMLTLGLVLFSAASAGCALAPDLATLVAARCVQAAGGAAVVCAALELMPVAAGGEASAARTWAAAGAIGTALGPAVGGALTQLISWEAIFIAQVPVVLAAVAAVGVRVPPVRARAGRPNVNANIALALVSAGLTAALFLLVLLMINGWGLDPIVAAVGVSVMPVTAIISGRLSILRGSAPARAAAGTVGVATGLAALGLMPGASVAWTLAPQVLVGLGLGLTLGALTEVALEGRSPQAIHGGWTVAARHAGVVVGILVLTPVFVADLDAQSARAQDAVISLALDARIDFATKIALANEGVKVLDGTQGRVPDAAPVFAAVTPEADDVEEFRALERAVTDQLSRAGTTSVARSFLTAAILAGLALIPILLARRRVSL